ncbi:Citryl-CoA lyase [Delftia sp. Cs1-4]|uniref:HpcH/HpaI aldolase/citrate lyase family protein n=1 Tax=Delftia sp. (strain Cs1-4) TaxID=742013 RepID=UPI00020E7977|nr:CoA ester lyase [Delftia sp. Cs1-4]AEF88671.1 Citryl-CoA lyase [Delftia sp. Cs1-4]
MSAPDAGFRAPLRSALYLPASNGRAIEKARTLDADAVIFDLEDAVAPQSKAEARRNLVQAFANGKVAAGLNVIRTNALDSEEFSADLDILRSCVPDAVLVPKVAGPADVARARQRVAAAVDGFVPALWCMIETAEGLQRVADIAGASIDGAACVDCLVIGTNDIARETGVSAGEGRRYLMPWLMSAVLAAKAHRLAILDGVWNDFKDAAGFDAEAAQARMMGFDGKTLIHPAQVEPANRTFAPSAQAIEEAHAIVAAFERPENAGKGVINLDGRMVELLHLDMAQRLLKQCAQIKARAVGGP